jgi:protein ImuB
MTAGGELPERVLVVWCPGWPEAGQETGAAGDDAGPGGGAAPGAGQRAHRAPDFGQVVSVVEEFCPRVEVLRPGACAIGVRGPARYFGGEGALAAKIIDAVAGGGGACRVGIADGLFAARLAAEHARPARHGQDTRPARHGQDTRPARHGRDTRPAPTVAPVSPAHSGAAALVAPGRARAFLAPFPVSVLDGPGAADLAALLPRLGIGTLGEFASLPAADVVNRFGVPGVIAHRLAHGLDPRPLAPRPPSADLSVSAEFDPPARLAEPVVFAAKALAERMHDGLAAGGLACVRVQVQAVWEDGRQITRLWRHDGLLSALAVAERVRWQLAAGQTAQSRPSPVPAPPVADEPSAVQIPAPRGAAERTADGYPGGIALLRLTPDQLVRDQGRQLGLWGDAVVTDRVARAAVRVQAMLGHDAVTRPVLAGGRSPDEQVTLVPYGGGGGRLLPPARPGRADEPGGPDGPGRAGEPWPGRIPPPSPATVYPSPLPARIADGSGATVAVSGRGLVSAPPARMSADGAPWLAVTAWAGPWPVTERWWHPPAARRRARFQLVTEDGAAWLVAVQEGSWLIEARYD